MQSSSALPEKKASDAGITQSIVRYLQDGHEDKHSEGMIAYRTIQADWKAANGNVDQFREAFARFLVQREIVLLNTSRDYWASNNETNRLCIALVEILFPKEHVPDRLYQHARTENRPAWAPTWKNTLDEEALPELPFIVRTGHDTIHDLELIIDNAVTALSRDEIEMKSIWVGTDAKESVPFVTKQLGVQPGKLNPLTAKELETLSQLSYPLKTLIDYSRSLQDQGATNLYLLFTQLRDDLKKGDAKQLGGAYEFFSGDSANEGLAKFGMIWAELVQKVGAETMKQIVSTRCENALSMQSRDSLDACIKDLFDPSSRESDRINEKKCISLLGGDIETCLADENIKNRLENPVKYGTSSEHVEAIQAILKKHAPASVAGMTIQRKTFKELQQLKESIYQDLTSHFSARQLQGDFDHLDNIEGSRDQAKLTMQDLVNNRFLRDILDCNAKAFMVSKIHGKYPDLNTESLKTLPVVKLLSALVSGASVSDDDFEIDGSKGKWEILLFCTYFAREDVLDAILAKSARICLAAPPLPLKSVNQRIDELTHESEILLMCGDKINAALVTKQLETIKRCLEKLKKRSEEDVVKTLTFLVRTGTTHGISQSLINYILSHPILLSTPYAWLETYKIRAIMSPQAEQYHHLGEMTKKLAKATLVQSLIKNDLLAFKTLWENDFVRDVFYGNIYEVTHDTALIIAARFGRMEMIKLMLSDQHVAVMQKNKQTNTALDIAREALRHSVEGSQADLTETIVALQAAEAKAYGNAKNEFRILLDESYQTPERLVHLVESFPKLLTDRMEEGNTPWMLATGENAKFLSQFEVDPLAINEQKQTALQMVRSGDQRIKLKIELRARVKKNQVKEIESLLMEHKVYEHGRWESLAINKTPSMNILAYAAQQNKPDIVEFFLAKNPTLRRVDEAGVSIYDWIVILFQKQPNDPQYQRIFQIASLQMLQYALKHYDYERFKTIVDLLATHNQLTIDCMVSHKESLEVLLLGDQCPDHYLNYLFSHLGGVCNDVSKLNKFIEINGSASQSTVKIAFHYIVSAYSKSNTMTKDIQSLIDQLKQHYSTDTLLKTAIALEQPSLVECLVLAIPDLLKLDSSIVFYNQIASICARQPISMQSQQILKLVLVLGLIDAVKRKNNDRVLTSITELSQKKLLTTELVLSRAPDCAPLLPDSKCVLDMVIHHSAPSAITMLVKSLFESVSIEKHSILFSAIRYIPLEKLSPDLEDFLIEKFRAYIFKHPSPDAYIRSVISDNQFFTLGMLRAINFSTDRLNAVFQAYQGLSVTPDYRYFQSKSLEERLLHCFEDNEHAESIIDELLVVVKSLGNPKEYDLWLRALSRSYTRAIDLGYLNNHSVEFNELVLAMKLKTDTLTELDFARFKPSSYLYILSQAKHIEEESKSEKPSIYLLRHLVAGEVLKSPQEHLSIVKKFPELLMQCVTRKECELAEHLSLSALIFIYQRAVYSDLKRWILPHILNKLHTFSKQEIRQTLDMLVDYTRKPIELDDLILAVNTAPVIKDRLQARERNFGISRFSVIQDQAVVMTSKTWYQLQVKFNLKNAELLRQEYVQPDIMPFYAPSVSLFKRQVVTIHNRWPSTRNGSRDSLISTSVLSDAAVLDIRHVTTLRSR